MGLSFKSIAKLLNVSSTTLFYQFRKLGLIPRDKYSYGSWNSGLSYKDDTRILSGKNHPRWKNKSKYYIDFKNKRKEIIDGITKCSMCDSVAKILHHKDKNTDNNEYSNLIPLCSSCHTTLHNKERGITVYKHSCEQCGKEFTVLHNKKCSQKFCSLSCKSKYAYHNNITYLRNQR